MQGSMVKYIFASSSKQEKKKVQNYVGWDRRISSPVKTSRIWNHSRMQWTNGGWAEGREERMLGLLNISTLSGLYLPRWSWVFRREVKMNPKATVYIPTDCSN